MGLLVVGVVLSAFHFYRNVSPLKQYEVSVLLWFTATSLVAILAAIGLGAGALAVWGNPLWIAFGAAMGIAAGIMVGAGIFFVSRMGRSRSTTQLGLDIR